MSYSTIFNVKPKKENKLLFCQRISKLLNEIEFCDNGHIYNDGPRMLNTLFKYSKLNNGFSSIQDLINESGKKCEDIFELAKEDNDFISMEEILINIDIIVNCLNFKKNENRYFYNDDLAMETLEIIMKSIAEFLLCNGFKITYDEEKDQFFILENDLSIDIENIDNKKLKDDAINFYYYKNEKNIEEKKKILFNLLYNLESRKNEISNLFGEKVSKTLFSYANNINIRHDNCNENNKSYFNSKINELKEEELIKWYDYIYSFGLNIYTNLDKLKYINVDGSYK